MLPPVCSLLVGSVLFGSATAEDDSASSTVVGSVAASSLPPQPTK